ncbi:MAG: hypothetical protein AAF808_12785, partial [Cyanobacteria bacterium P01_D01_bin.2]
RRPSRAAPHALTTPRCASSLRLASRIPAADDPARHNIAAARVPSRRLSQVPPLPTTDSPPPPPSTTKPDPSFIAQCRDELSRCIGPMADIVIEETLEGHPTATPQQIVQILAEQISNADQATAFLSHICIPDETASQTMLETSGAASPDFIDRCRQTLAQCIGPMASMLVEDTLADYPALNAEALVEQLATQIPDAQKAEEFRQQLRHAIVEVKSP